MEKILVASYLKIHLHLPEMSSLIENVCWKMHALSIVTFSGCLSSHGNSKILEENQGKKGKMITLVWQTPCFFAFIH